MIIWLIVIAFAFSAGFLTGALVAHKNPSKTDAVVNGAQTVDSDLKKV